MLCLIFLFYFIASRVIAQNNDSLWQVYNSIKNADTSRSNALHVIIKFILRSEPDSAYKFALIEIKETKQHKLLKREVKYINFELINN